MIKFFGIEIEKKTDFLAFAAFLISVTGIIYQVIVFFRGADVNLIPPEQVVLRTYSYYDEEEKYLAFIVPLAYVNTGHLGYNAIIKKEKIKFIIKGNEYEHQWQYFIFTHPEKTNLLSENKEPAHPFALMAGGAKAHETFFVAYPQPCPEKLSCDPNKNFLKLTT